MLRSGKDFVVLYCWNAELRSSFVEVHQGRLKIIQYQLRFRRSTTWLNEGGVTRIVLLTRAGDDSTILSSADKLDSAASHSVALTRICFMLGEDCTRRERVPVSKLLLDEVELLWTWAGEVAPALYSCGTTKKPLGDLLKTRAWYPMPCQASKDPSLQTSNKALTIAPSINLTTC